MLIKFDYVRLSSIEKSVRLVRLIQSGLVRSIASIGFVSIVSTTHCDFNESLRSASIDYERFDAQILRLTSPGQGSFFRLAFDGIWESVGRRRVKQKQNERDTSALLISFAMLG